MRIGIDARPLISESPSGIGIYLLEILRNFKKNENTTYILYTNEPIRNQDPVLTGFEKRVVGGKIGTFAVCFGLDKALKEDKIDEFWGTEHMLPLFAHGVKKVLTVHDLALLINPKWGSRKNAIMQNIFCRLSCKRADKIIAVSEATKKDIVSLLSIDANRITAILNGGGYSEYITPSDAECKKIKKRFEIEAEPFFAYTGNIEPRKNIVTILKAFEIACDRLDKNVSLILAGKLSWRTQPIIEAIEQNKYKNQIHLPGYISEEEKKYLMHNACAFVFPSNYEGFGIPVVEAMSCGGVVITANNSSLKEVGGKAAFYVQKTDEVAQLADRMLQCFNLSDSERKKIMVDGESWAAQFSWKKCAHETQAVLEQG